VIFKRLLDANLIYFLINKNFIKDNELQIVNNQLLAVTITKANNQFKSKRATK
jgi:hypothetical protein